VDHWVKPDYNTALIPQPKKLEWKITKEFQQNIDGAQEKLNQLIHAVNVKVLTFQYFGKGLIKNFNMSPDAYCQMALQLTYYRVHGEPCLTYESAATVRFHHGRTETVRSCSNESFAFVKAMDNPKLTDSEKLKCLASAVKRHVRTMRAATNGDGIDRHLLGLRVLAASTGQGMPAIFTDKGYGLDFKMSTSQTPATGMLGGGFSPLTGDGYGVSYVVAEDRLWFHISSYANSKTNNDTFHNVLRQSLLDMQTVCYSNPALASKLSKRQFRIQRVE